MTEDERAAVLRASAAIRAADLDHLSSPAVVARGERIHRQIQPSWRGLHEPFTL
jgi:hypothetical protein